MAVDPVVSRSHVETELERAKPIVASYGLDIDWQPDHLLIRAAVSARDGERYIFELQFDDYRELPPLIDAVHPDVEGERNTARCFPRGGYGYVHGHNLICAPWSRRAYKKLYVQGPHDDWDISKWSTTVAGGHARQPKTCVGDILVTLAQIVQDPQNKGRRS